MVRVEDGLEHEAKDECNSIACIYIVLSIILTSTDNYHTHTRPVEALAYNQMTQVIDRHKISHHIVKRKEALQLDIARRPVHFENLVIGVAYEDYDHRRSQHR